MDNYDWYVIESWLDLFLFVVSCGVVLGVACKFWGS